MNGQRIAMQFHAQGSEWVWVPYSCPQPCRAMMQWQVKEDAARSSEHSVAWRVGGGGGEGARDLIGQVGKGVGDTHLGAGRVVRESWQRRSAQCWRVARMS